MLTLREALTRATDQLAANPHLRPTALPDAALLLMHLLQIERSTLIAHPERTLDREAQAAYQRLIERRLTFEPIQYITGTQEFYGLALRVTPAVLIPRPETELLVEAVLAHFKAVPHSSQPHRDEWVHPRMLEVGTGSGAIAIALAHHLPQAEITALDISEQALTLAQENAQTHRANITFLHSDLLTAVANEPLYDAIISNPPYIPAAEILHPQVSTHEPTQALFAGPQGLDIYRRLIPQAHALLKPNGLLALELGHGQQPALTQLLSTWHHVEFLSDLQQIPRVALARRP